MKVKPSKLRDALKHSRQVVRAYMDNVHEAIEESGGSWYTKRLSSDDEKRPLPLLPQAMNVYTRSIVAQAPTALITTKRPELKAAAADIQLAVQASLKNSNMTDILRSACRSALVGFAMAKTALEQKASVNPDTGEPEVGPGDPFTRLISMDDAAWDMTAKSWDEVEWIGHRFRASLDEIKANPAYKNTDKLTTGDGSREERASDLTTGGGRKEDAELYERVELWEIYLVRENKLVTIPGDTYGGADVVLREQDWGGPQPPAAPFGPFRILGFNFPTAQPLPNGPMTWFMGLHQIANKVFLKLARQAERQKTNPTIVNGGPSDIDRQKNLNDGDWGYLAPGQEVKETRSGGPDPVNAGFSVRATSEFIHYTNMDGLSGAGPQAPTATQEKLLEASSSQLINDMQSQMIDFARDVCHDHAYYVFNHPTRVLELLKRLDGFDIEIPKTFDPLEDRGDWLDYQFDIEPFSMRGQTPAALLQTLNNLLTTLIPLAPMLAQEGEAISGRGILEAFQKYTNSPDLASIIRPAEPPPQGEAPAGGMPGGGGGPSMASMGKPNGNYTRRSESTPQGADNALAEKMMSMPREGMAAG